MNTNQSRYKTLPFFNLDIVIMPGERVPLRVFEPRYIQLIRECRRGPGTFGILYSIGGKVMHLGTEVRIHRVVADYPGGEMVIVVEGIILFRRISFRERMEGKLYSGGMVKTLNVQVMSTDCHLLDLTEELGIITGKGRREEKPEAIDLNKLVRELELSQEDRYRYISMKHIREKEKFLTGLLRLEKSIQEQAGMLNDRIRSN